MALDPVVSAQEAANLAGSLFEKLYGIRPFAGHLDCCQCFESDSDMSYHPAGGGVMRASLACKPGEEAADGVLFSTNASQAARWMRRPASLSPWIIRLAVKKSRPCRRRRLPACFIQRASTPTTAGSYGYWDETEASYAGTVEKLKQQAKEQLSGSALDRRRGSDGCPCGAGRKDRGKRREPHQPAGSIATAEKPISFTGDITLCKPYVNYDFGGYPLRAYRITETTPI